MGKRDFADFVVELMQPWRPVTARRMFGGHGIYHAGLMFALISDGTLYLKVDDESRGAFEAAGLLPFVYEAKGRRVALSYHRAPDAMLDEPDVAANGPNAAGRPLCGRICSRRPGKRPCPGASQHPVGPASPELAGLGLYRLLVSICRYSSALAMRGLVLWQWSARAPVMT